MRVILCCSDAIPHFTNGGIGMTPWGIVETLCARGHDVQVISRCKEDELYKVRALQDMGVSLSLFPQELDFFKLTVPQRLIFTGDVAELVHSFNPDVVVAFPERGIIWLSQVHNAIPRVCFLGDLPHLVNVYRSQYYSRSEPMSYAHIGELYRASAEYKNMYLPLLKSCTKVGNFCAHHAEWLKEQGVDCEHTRMAILDSAFPGWVRESGDMPKNDKTKILLAGHMLGIATMSGLYFLAEDIMPHLVNKKKYDINVYGGDDFVTLDLHTRLKAWPQIKLKGFIPDIRKEILQADIFLCPTPIPLGLRTRLIEVMSLGGFIICHVGNTVGMPEIVNGVNAAVGSTGQEIADLIKYYSNHPEERYEMGLAARKTYEQYFSPEVAGGVMVDMIEGVVN